jgi:hypothetical protein
VSSHLEWPSRDPEKRLTALRIDDTLAESHSALGFVKFVSDWDWSGAEYEFKRAFDVNPRLGLPLQRHAMYLQVMGRVDDAIAESKRSLELEPLSSNENAQMGRLFTWIKVDPCFDGVRDDPRYRDLLRRMKIPE